MTSDKGAITRGNVGDGARKEEEEERVGKKHAEGYWGRRRRDEM